MVGGESSMSIAPTGLSEIAIWDRIIHSDQSAMSAEAARYFLQLKLDQGDLDRMHELAVRNQQGLLTADEQAALNNLRQVGLQIDVLRSKARLALRNQTRDA